MAPVVYYMSMSPAARATLLLVKALGIEVDLKEINLMAGEHMTPDFLTKNPFHTVPTLEDGDYTLWDSHAINVYLIEKYAPDSDLYPKDPQARGTVLNRMFFNVGTAFPKLLAIGQSIFGGAKTVGKDKIAPVLAMYDQLETLLQRDEFVAGENLTVADLSLVATISSLNVFVPIAENKYPKISRWLDRLKALPYYFEGNQKGLDTYQAMFKSKLA
ncbi:unnamed protein product [Phyllotreta striolata]|uniref:Glutathione S-transferase n=1 Tax=Phyllotreta striolata TaxID=444603 RepID=A0A9N9TZL0_PHYSR|nr:unnamed protein product [Phyllotreta striolata]